MRRLILTLLLFMPSIIYAHVYILECNPLENAKISEAPKKVTIAFVGTVEPMFSKVEVFDQEGNKVSKKTTFKEDDTIMEVELEEGLGSGEYTVKWMCMSLDGHKQTGNYTFTVK